jgi:hypothetical protein
MPPLTRARRRLAGLALVTAAAASLAAAAAVTRAEEDVIASPRGNARTSLPSRPAVAPFDLVRTSVRRVGTNVLFTEEVSGRAGAPRPTANGRLAGAEVFSYVWPVSLDPEIVGFEKGTGTLALGVTVHPDFDDTPRYDENGDGDPANDGNLWHAHWVVLTPDSTCGAGALKVRDIPAGTSPKLPATWPGLPLFIDSPGYEPQFTANSVRVAVPLKELGFPSTFRFDGVTAALRVNASVHDPLLCVVDVFDVASGNLSLPGQLAPPPRHAR